MTNNEHMIEHYRQRFDGARFGARAVPLIAAGDGPGLVHLIAEARALAVMAASQARRLGASAYAVRSILVYGRGHADALYADAADAYQERPNVRNNAARWEAHLISAYRAAWRARSPLMRARARDRTGAMWCPACDQALLEDASPRSSPCACRSVRERALARDFAERLDVVGGRLLGSDRRGVASFYVEADTPTGERLVMEGVVNLPDLVVSAWTMTPEAPDWNPIRFTHWPPLGVDVRFAQEYMNEPPAPATAAMCVPANTSEHQRAAAFACAAIEDGRADLVRAAGHVLDAALGRSVKACTCTVCRVWRQWSGRPEDFVAHWKGRAKS